MARGAYIAQYPLKIEANGNKNLEEIVLVRTNYCSEEICKEWDILVKNRPAGAPMLQFWYHDKFEVKCLAQTNQPFILD